MGYKFNPFTGNLDEVGAGGGGGTPGGSTTQIQFNDAGSFGGDVDLTWNKTTNVMTVAGDVNLSDGGSFTTTLQTITPTANRTVSIPDATGTLALVAGSSGQLVYNNAGVYAGIPGSTVGASGNVTLNASSGFAGNLLDLQVGGTSAFRFTGTSINGPAVFGFNTTGSFRFDSSGAAGPFFIQSNQVRVANFGITFCTGTNYNTPEFSLLRDAANTLAQRNDTNAQTFRVYNTYTSSTNYELGKLEWSSNAFRIGTEKGSGGGTARDLELQTDGTTRLTVAATTGAITASGNLSASTIYATGTSTGFVGNRLLLDSANQDVVLIRDAAGTLAQRNGANAQTFRVYNTYTSSTNYELGKLEWSGNVFRIGTEKGSGGGTARALEFQTDGTTRVTLGASNGLTVQGNVSNVFIDCITYFASTTAAGSRALAGSGFSVGSAYPYQFSSTTGAGGTPDAGLIRETAGVVKVTDGSTGNGTLLAQHRLTGTAPATASSTGTAGDIRYDADYIYVCTATNTWKRAALTTW